MNIEDTNRMGAKIKVIDNTYANVRGRSKLIGKKVVATDLRGGASMVICGLIAKGTTTITNIEHILRGYEDMIGKLTKVGANIKISD